MNWEQKKEYARKAHKRQAELIEKLWSEPAPSQMEKDLIILEMIELDIMPDSRWWRWGYKSVLKRARIALKEKINNEQQREGKNQIKP